MGAAGDGGEAAVGHGGVGKVRQRRGRGRRLETITPCTSTTGVFFGIAEADERFQSGPTSVFSSFAEKLAPSWHFLRTTGAWRPFRLLLMPLLAAGNTVYTHPMAKVMISIPDKLLERLDLRAKESGETRSGFLRRLVEREVETGEQRRREEINRLWDEVRIEVPADKPELLDVVQLIREDRESH